ncbi:MAG TPA: GerMN domain-containing protein [Candidatus Eubacterium avistercoris]|uniref:GerMN domain-containing protein n=1 Tax=Candidatus Eubacterium avistercoris TaxID=2838567 RepID=A0A9D2D527_9FIRM|nr:GerMN domain-containing protein [Candidatus Eubacterium avistercoris]
MKKRLKTGKMLVLFLTVIALFVLAGCGAGSKSGFQIYYLTEDGTGLVGRSYEMESSGTENQIREIIDQLSEKSKEVDYVNLFPQDVRIEKYQLDDKVLKLYFNKAYEKMDPVEEVLCRGGIVRTFLQLEGVEGVSFYVDNATLTDVNGDIVGVMTQDSFADNPGKNIKNIQETELTLYFASKDGKGLTKEVQKVYYNSNTSVEKLAVERLMKQPETEGAKSAIPEGTHLINVSVLDGVCLVNFDEGFLVQNYDIAEPVVIYSIVDSLTELPSVNTVQISVNGETNMTYREDYSLSKQYERNLDLVTEENQDVNIIVEERGEKGEN